jgi:hypothetical protein
MTGRSIYQKVRDVTRTQIPPTAKLALIGAALALIFVLCTASAQTFPSSAQTVSSPASYRIYLDRPEKAGDEYHIETTSTSKTTTSVTSGNQFLRSNEEGFSIELVADVKILDVANNWATRKRFTILSSKVTRAGTSLPGAVPLLPNGTVVIGSISTGNPTYQVNGKDVPPEVATALSSVVGMHVSNVGDDQMFGSATARAIGETWPININSVKALLKEMKAQGGKQEISGNTTLEKLQDNRLVVRSGISVTDVVMPIAPRVIPEGGDIQFEYRGLIPLQLGDMNRDVTGRMLLNFYGSAVGDDGNKLKVQVIFQSASSYKMRPLK